MQLPRTLSYTLLLLSSANAFTLTFYLGKKCSGEEVGTVSNVDGTCTVCSNANTSKARYSDDDRPQDSMAQMPNQSRFRRIPPILLEEVSRSLFLFLPIWLFFSNHLV